MALDAAEVPDWLRLTGTPGIGDAAARRLLAAFGLPSQVLGRSRADLAAVVGDAAARALQRPPDPATAERIARALDWLRLPGHAALSLADPEYPAALLAVDDPPPLLWASGRLELLAAPRLLAIVGSREPSPQGRRDAARFAEDLSAAGVTIVSGLARGVDGQAHAGALRGPGSTIAVLGTGCDRVYPATARELAARIAEQGLLLSEFPLGAPPAREHFPRRNRIISGLSRGVLVTEAAERSGSLITARLAAEQGREVFAVPGSIHNPLSRGCHRLLREGARLAESAADVIDELGWGAPTAPTASAPASDAATPAQREVLDALGWDATGFDALVARSGREPRWLAEVLLELELAGRVERLPGARFQRIARG